MRVSVTGSFALTFLVLAVAAGRAQVPPLPPPTPPPAPRAAPPPPAPGFVSAYEIMHTLRAAGFDPLAPPLREGTIYVARATDYRGILTRVVLDARTGAIRDANRIVPGPGNYSGPYGEGPYGGAYGPGPYGPGPYSPGPYGPRPYGPRPYGPGYGPGPDGPAAYGRVGIIRPSYGLSPDANGPAAPAARHSATGASVTPLPRPRPPQLASRKSTDDIKPATALDAKPSAAIDPKPDAKPDPKPDVTTAAPLAPPAPAAQAGPATTAPAKPSKAPSALSINN